ncbi:MAG: hypothetical protein IJ862_05670 [Selenomonadaceae bacterium]|nr:hypothetical protein [Selenomonadaceae bacterium]
MLKKLGISAMAALMALGTLSITEAASSDDNQNALCCRGSYCYNQDDNNGNCAGGCYNDGYCDGNRGCW